AVEANLVFGAGSNAKPTVVPRTLQDFPNKIGQGAAREDPHLWRNDKAAARQPKPHGAGRRWRPTPPHRTAAGKVRQHRLTGFARGEVVVPRDGKRPARELNAIGELVVG